MCCNSVQFELQGAFTDTDGKVQNHGVGHNCKRKVLLQTQGAVEKFMELYQIETTSYRMMFSTGGNVLMPQFCCPSSNEIAEIFNTPFALTACCTPCTFFSPAVLPSFSSLVENVQLRSSITAIPAGQKNWSAAILGSPIQLPL